MHRWRVVGVGALATGLVVVSAWRGPEAEPPASPSEDGPSTTAPTALDRPAWPGAATSPRAPVADGARASSPIWVRGDVVDDAGRPASAALDAVDAASGAVCAHGESDGDAGGAFALQIPAGLRAVAVTARGTAGTSATARVDLDEAWGDACPVGTLVLRRAGTVVVVAQVDGAPVAGARVRWAPIEAHRLPDVPGDGVATAGDVLRPGGVTDRAGRHVVRGVPWGRVALEVAAPGLRGDAAALVEDGTVTVPVELRRTRSLRVRLLDAASSAAVPDGRLDVAAAPAPTRDAWRPLLDRVPVGPGGRIELRELPGGSWVRVAASGPGWVGPHDGSGLAGVVVPPDQDDLELRVPPLRIDRWPVQTVEGDPIEDGTVARLTRGGDDAGPFAPLSATWDRRSIRVERRADHASRSEARFPDGRLAWLDIRLEGGRWVPVPTDVRRPRSVVVRALDARTHAPVAGMGVRACALAGSPLSPLVVTGPDGLATLDGLPAATVRLRLEPNAPLVSPEHAGFFSTTPRDVDLQAYGPPPVVEWEVAFPVAAIVHVRADDGVPAGLVVWVRDVPASPRWRRPEALRVDEPEGTLRFLLRPSAGGQVVVSVGAPGFSTASAPLTPTGDGLVGRVTLRAAARIRVRVLAPEDGRVEPHLERWDGAAWARCPTSIVPPATRGEDVAVDDAPTGRVRVVDAVSGLTSDAAETSADRDDVVLVLDASAAGWAEGTLELPDGISDLEADVAARRRTPSDPTEVPSATGPSPRTVWGGRFRVRVPGTAEVVLTPTCPGCEPDPVHGIVTVRAPTRGLLLRMRRR